MEEFSANLNYKMQKEIQKLGKLNVSGSVPLNREVIMEELDKEALVVGMDFATIFQKDLNHAIEKEIRRLTRRMLHDQK